ncbi:hypothetical protein [Dyadobacter aurulentus]|uniref:hypothetical protein n=1 Tax=Dyadobacter sp. UC 10 TaxID=2605428 RepID=UPI0011F12F95|nr:hypothetical protein [Dyadobacter sp. UC 10]KAA0989634.1 hypothetical protein FXO21_05375 [Dyadobacter sp. UC 10]
MVNLKNILVGFIVSMVGSLPLGYINVIALKIFSTQGMSSLVMFVAGVVVVEFLLILLTLKAAKWLHRHKRFTKATEILSILFMLLLAASFFNAQQTVGNDAIPDYLSGYPPFLLGIFLNCINLVQIPFWLGWNLYLVNAEMIAVTGNEKYAYVSGTSAGTFAGVFLFVMIFQKILEKTSALSPWISTHIFSIIFISLAVMQAVKFYRKYRVQG